MNEEVTLSLQDSLVLVEALYEIALESEEADIVRQCMTALTNTEAGIVYLRAHPFTL